MSALADGSGYTLVASDGGVFAFDAPFAGSASGLSAAPIVGLAAGAAGGYTVVSSAGGVFAFPNGNFFGSQVGSGATAPVVGIAS